MNQEACQGQPEPVYLISLIFQVEGCLGLIVHGANRWQAIPGYTLLPAEFPGATLAPDETPETAAEVLARRTLSCAARIASSRTIYGPSVRRRIDRLGAEPGEDPVPLLRDQRILPEEREDGIVLRSVVLRAYLAVATGATKPCSDLAGLLWLPPDALRASLRGLPFAELLAREGVRWQPSEASLLPENAFVFVPSEYGERFMLRALAKYGPDAVLQGENNGVGF